MDLNYLGHEVVLYTKHYKNGDYKCSKCGIVLYYNTNDRTYFIVNDSEDDEVGPMCNITCDEQIIKNIIE